MRLVEQLVDRADAAGRWSRGSASWRRRPPSGGSAPWPTWSRRARCTEQQEERLAATLQRIYSRPIALHVEVDPTIQGGLVIKVGDEVIDGSATGRLDAPAPAARGLTASADGGTRTLN